MQISAKRSTYRISPTSSRIPSWCSPVPRELYSGNIEPSPVSPSRSGFQSKRHLAPTVSPRKKTKKKLLIIFLLHLLH